jgi:hypothetical protein
MFSASAHLKACSEIQQDIIAPGSSADSDADGQVLDVVADGRVVRNLTEWDRDFGAFVEGRVDFVEDAERRLGSGLVSVLS